MIDNNQYQGLTEALKLKSTLEKIETGRYYAKNYSKSNLSFEPLQLYKHNQLEVKVPPPPSQTSLPVYTDQGQPFAQSHLSDSTQVLLASENVNQGDVMEYRDANNQSTFGLVKEVTKDPSKVIVEPRSLKQTEDYVNQHPRVVVHILTDAHSRSPKFLKSISKSKLTLDVDRNAVVKFLFGLLLPNVEDKNEPSVEGYIKVYLRVVIAGLLFGLIIFLAFNWWL